MLETGKNKAKFLRILLQKFFDTYFIVIQLIFDLMENNTVVEQQKLVIQLHLGM